VKKIHFVRCALIFSGIFNVARKMLITKDQSAIRYGFSIGRWADWVVINPQQPPWHKEASRADWAALDPLAVSRYCLRVSALPVVQQLYGAAMTGI
jgi:hypothetical protein